MFKGSKSVETKILFQSPPILFGPHSRPNESSRTFSHFPGPTVEPKGSY